MVRGRGRSMVRGGVKVLNFVKLDSTLHIQFLGIFSGTLVSGAQLKFCVTIP